MTKTEKERGCNARDLIDLGDLQHRKLQRVGVINIMMIGNTLDRTGSLSKSKYARTSI